MSADSGADVGYYDRLRRRGDAAASSSAAFPDPHHVGRNLHRIDLAGLARDDGNGDGGGATTSDPFDDLDAAAFAGLDSVLLCHVPIFLRYTSPSGEGGCSPVSYTQSAAALLAMHHFNTGSGSVVPELDGVDRRCDVRLTAEVVDTGSSGINAVEDATRMVTRSPGSIAEPQPCAVVGSQISSVTARLSSVTGVFDLFQVSSSAMSTELENPVQYPLLARSHTDVAGFGEMSVSYLKEHHGINNFGLLFPNDAYGIGFGRSVLEAAAKHHGAMRGYSAHYIPTLTSPDEIEADIRSALAVLKRSGCNYIIAAFYPEFFKIIFEIAYDMGVAGPDKFWLISGTAALAPTTLSGKFILEKDSAAVKAISGNGIIFCLGGLPGVGGSFDRFVKEWKNVGSSEQLLGYINQKQPAPRAGSGNCSQGPDFFLNPPQHDATFTYDGVVGMALAACGVRNASPGPELFTGKMQRDFFARNEFRGASGDFFLREEFPTRTSDSSYFVIVNTAANPLNDTHVTFKGSPLSFFWETGSRTWERRGNQTFLYHGGAQSPPPEFDHTRNLNQLTKIRPFGWALGAIIMILCIVFGAWTYKYRANRVVRAGQPMFLGMVVAGCLVMASAIFPLGIDDSIVSASGCTLACQSVPWLLALGFTTTYAAIFAKIWRVNRLFRHASSFRRVQISQRDVLPPLLVLLTLNIALLLIWTLVDPLSWKRVPIGDSDGTASYGICTSDGVASVVSGALILTLNMFALILANVQAYQARKVETEYAESTYIGIAMLLIMQVLLVGVPLMFLVRDNPPASFFIQVCIIFMVCSATLLLIFVPKVVRQRYIVNERMRGVTPSGIEAYTRTGVARYTGNSGISGMARYTANSGVASHAPTVGGSDENSVVLTSAAISDVVRCHISDDSRDLRGKLDDLCKELQEKGLDSESLLKKVGLWEIDSKT